MPEEVDSQDGEKAREETVEVLLAEAQRSMSRQFESSRGLDSKASRLFQVVTLATTLLTIAQGWFFQKQEVASVLSWWVVLGVFAIAMLLYLATICYLIRAFRVKVYYLPIKMDLEHIRTTYLSLTKSETQEKLLASHIEHYQTNWAISEDKAKWVDRALILVGIDIVLLIAVIAIGTLVVSG